MCSEFGCYFWSGTQIWKADKFSCEISIFFFFLIAKINLFLSFNIKFRIQFKVLLFVYKSVAGLAPSYLSDLLSFDVTNRPLRSSNSQNDCSWYLSLKLKGDCAFSVAAPKLWNNLPSYVRSAFFKSTALYSLFVDPVVIKCAI